MSDDLEQKADRFNVGKTRWSLMDFESLEPLVQVLEFGATKYSRDNWKKGMPVSEICDSLLRHLIAFMSGEDDDKESNLPHIGHILCNAMFLSYNQRHNARFDDRVTNNAEIQPFGVAIHNPHKPTDI